MAVRLLADNNLRRGDIFLFRDRGHDIVTARELNLHRATDDHLLLFAATEQRTLLTSNVGDFVLLHRAWLRWSANWNVAAEHAGIIVFPQDQPWDEAQTVAEVETVIGTAVAGLEANHFRNRLWRWRPLGGWRLVDSR